MSKKLATYLLFFFVIFAARAEDTRFIMSAPNAVEMGKQFRLSFTLNERGTNLKLPAGLTDNFEVLMGPSTGQSTSIRTINGRTTSEVTFSYTYILRAKKEGKFEIRPASIEVGGKVFESNNLEIQVVKAQSQPAQPQSGNSGSSNQQSESVDLGKDNLFVKVEMSKTSVYRGEQIIATVKLYVNPNIPISGFEEVNLPTYEGFYTQDIEIPQQINFTREVYDNKIYQVGILKKTILFPQQNGRLTVEPFNMSLLVQQRVKQRSFFDDFFSGLRTVRATVTSSPVSVNVKDLPPAPANFMGGVGSFNVSSSISGQDVTTNDAVTLTLKVSGTGNIRLIQSPELQLPTDFEVYDPQSTDNVNATNNGVTGTKTIEYLFQPRFEGDYTIPSIKFAYFNPASGSYVTKSTDEYDLHVVKGSDEQSATVVSSLRKEDVQLIGQDIRFIKQGDASLNSKGFTFFGTIGFYSMYAGSGILFLILFLVYRKKARENANIALMRNKKANRVATKRLKAAAGYMKQNNNEAFHDSILKAFWGYLSDKLGIPVADLNRDSAVASLTNKNVEQQIINDFVEVVDQCEFARYAPAGGAEARSELYNKAESTMSRLEKQIKR
ncbi:BatD family protein [Maribellus maritimus]|uniref:BatD family protein n=1 Tax=Maribellus maritimus TaxID=2870838 RepID=UPI001EEBADA1|nr:BatD family protein [Maribellus maritimus]MCG6189204.1 BatD family protein [Maribellus maritimus]